MSFTVGCVCKGVSPNVMVNVVYRSVMFSMTCDQMLMCFTVSCVCNDVWPDVESHPRAAIHAQEPTNRSSGECHATVMYPYKYCSDCQLNYPYSQNAWH